MRCVPPRIRATIFNELLLKFSFLYRTKFINYESQLGKNNGIEDLLTKLNTVLDIEGNIIECGSYVCGTAVIIANYLRSVGVNKKVYALDLFGGGFDLNELEIERQAGLTQAKDSAFTHTSYDYIKRKIEKLGVSYIIIPVKGFFKDTLPNIDSRFCFALIDCDLKKSVLYTAETIWPKLSKDGVMLFDDYDYELYHAFKGPKEAVDEFVRNHRSEISEHGLLNRLYYVIKT
jgi:Macrocin-O-methyltransferase (TylF)